MFRQSFYWVVILICLLFFVSIFLYWTELSDAFLQNLSVIGMLLPFILIFILLIYLRSKKYLKGKVEEYYTLAGVILAVLFFIFTNFQTDSQKFGILNATDTYNCELATTTITSVDLDQKTIVSQQFITDVYAQNLGFIYEKQGNAKFITTKKKIYLLNTINGLINIVSSGGVTAVSSQATSAIQFVLNGNTMIAGNLRSYYSNFCK